MIPQLILNGIIAGSIYALVAISFTLIYKAVRFFHFAHGVVYTAGAYFAYTFIISFHFNIVLSFFISIILTALLGVAIERFVYYALRKHNASNLIFLLASFGVFIFIQNFIQLIYGAQILTIRTGPIKEGHQLSIFGYHLDAVITDIQIIILIVSVVLMVLIWLFVQKSKFGKAIRAVSDDPVAANVVGINPERIIQSSFGIGSALAGVAGILISFETNIEPTMGFSALLRFLGMPSSIAAPVRQMIYGLLLVILMIKRPQGIMGAFRFK